MKRKTITASATPTDRFPGRSLAARAAGRSILAACAVAALGLGSCSKESLERELAHGADAITIFTTLGAAGTEVSGSTSRATRAPVADGGENNRSTLADMHFLRKDGVTEQTDFSGVTPLTASRDASGRIVFADNAPFYDVDGLNAWFTAYWPSTPAEGAVVTQGSSVVWTVDGSRDILLSTLDPAHSFNAGNNTDPATAAMALEHALAQLQVVCTADASASEATVRQTWGKITKIEITTSPATATYTYASNTLSYGTPQALSLWKADYSAKFEGQTHELTINNTTILAAGMYPPSTGLVRLKVYTEKLPYGKGIFVQLEDSGTPKDFERGLTHTVTLTFGASPKEITVTGTTITPWSTGHDGTFNVGDGEYNIPSPAEGFLYWNDPDVVKSGNFNNVTCTLQGPGLQSYNNWKGTVAGGSLDGGNGSYWYELNDLLANEKPFAMLEVAKEDEVVGGMQTMNWSDARQACWDKTTGGGGWRLPRQSELMWIYLNKTELEKTPGFTAFASDDYYWSATEKTLGTPWMIKFLNGTLSDDSSPTPYYVRCVREIHTRRMSVRDYYYSDGTTSTTLIDGKTVEGIVFWVDPDNIQHYKVIGLRNLGLTGWGAENVGIGDTDAYAGIRDACTHTTYSTSPGRISGKTNREILGRWLDDPSVNTTGLTIGNFPAFNTCNRMGEGWYLPALNELQYCYCTVNGVAPHLWYDRVGGAPGSNATAQGVFNARITAVGGQGLAVKYVSSTEVGDNAYYTMHFYNGDARTYTKSTTAEVRCIKDIAPL